MPCEERSGRAHLGESGLVYLRFPANAYSQVFNPDQFLRYSLVEGSVSSRTHQTGRGRGHVKRKAKPTGEISFHIPFEEFPEKSLENLLGHLEKAKPLGWIVEVSDVVEAQHMDCMKPLTHVVVHPPEEDSSPGSMGVMYQYCETCKTAVRVL